MRYLWNIQIGFCKFLRIEGLRAIQLGKQRVWPQISLFLGKRNPHQKFNLLRLCELQIIWGVPSITCWAGRRTRRSIRNSGIQLTRCACGSSWGSPAARAWYRAGHRLALVPTNLEVCLPSDLSGKTGKVAMPCTTAPGGSRSETVGTAGTILK